LSPSLELELRSLDQEELASLLKDYLSGRQIDALLARRDRILDIFHSDRD
jgi:hypothetical protein